MADDYYRSIEGFICLIEKDWLAFGHKFGERIGHGDSNYKDKQRSPIFLQWLECVYQLVLQFPDSFEFGERFLDTILFHIYSCLFGTFLFDCESERARECTSSTTHSLWAFIFSQHASYVVSKKPAGQAVEGNKEQETKNEQESAMSKESKDSEDQKNIASKSRKVAIKSTALRPNTKDVKLWMKAHFPLWEAEK